ncbi:MAG: hypothetical protein K9K35_02555 [Rhodoferax sp.]|nr:hypothetical protein [Rhodoferax sp.]
MTVDDGFFGQLAVVEKINELWGKVFLNSGKILNQHLKFGFDGVSLATDPTIQDRILGLQVFSAVIDVLLNSKDAGVELEYEQQRQLLNAKLQITTMEQLAAAILAKNQADYDRAVEALDKQAVL